MSKDLTKDKKDKNEKIFGMEEYKQIHDLVYEYQAGSNDAAEKLIDSFKTFLGKYIALVKYGQYSLDHYSVRSFIKLFVEDANERKKVNSYFAKGFGKSVADKTVARITGIFSNSTQEDVQQELISIFLTMCTKYKDTKPSFHHYIKSNFHYYAYRHFEKSTRDPIARGHVACLTTSSKSYSPSEGFIDKFHDNDFVFDFILSDDSVELEMEEMLNEIELHYNVMMSETTTVKPRKKVSIYEDDFLDVNWINGITCSNIFKELSAFERKILVMWYVNNKTDSDIAEEFGVCRGTINKRRAVAKNKLEQAVLKSKHIKM